MSKVTKVGWSSLGIPRVTGCWPADSPRGDLGEVVIPSESQNVVPAYLLVLHMFELILVIQAGEGLNFVVDFLKHCEEASGTLVVVGQAFGKIATDVLIDAGVAVVGGHKLANLDDRAVAEGLCICIQELTGQEVCKEGRVWFDECSWCGGVLPQEDERDGPQRCCRLPTLNLICVQVRSSPSK